MTALQIQAFVPRDGNLFIALPECLRETEVELSISKKETDRPRKMTKEERLAWMEKFAGSLQNVDYSDLRDETDREL